MCIFIYLVGLNFKRYGLVNDNNLILMIMVNYEEILKCSGIVIWWYKFGYYVLYL